MSIRVGVIGVGVMGADHARTLTRVISGATLSAVTDFDVDRAQALAASGIRVTSCCAGSPREWPTSTWRHRVSRRGSE